MSCECRIDSTDRVVDLHAWKYDALRGFYVCPKCPAICEPRRIDQPPRAWWNIEDAFGAVHLRVDARACFRPFVRADGSPVAFSDAFP